MTAPFNRRERAQPLLTGRVVSQPIGEDYAARLDSARCSVTQKRLALRSVFLNKNAPP